MEDQALKLWATVSLVTMVVFMLRHWRSDVGLGLVLAYGISFLVMHWLAPALYLLPWYDGTDLTPAVDGLRESTYAILAFVAGAQVVAFGLRRWGDSDVEAGTDTALLSDPRIVTIYLVAGTVFYALTFRIAGQIPTLGAVVSAGSTLVVAGVGLKCWNAWLTGRRTHLLGWLIASASLPLVTVIAQGFLGYGFVATLTIVTIVMSFYRPRWMLVGFFLLAYVGLSIYVTYMRDRTEIRSVVWSGAALSDRATRLQETFTDLEWFSLYDAQHIRRVDGRLNQGLLVGIGMAYLGERPERFARGATIWNAGLALIPRVLWPDKPIIAGSGNLVSEVTGIRFAQGTSVGVGQVLESYANFGTPGVVGIFLILGGLVMLLDQKSRQRLVHGDVHGFVLWFLPGLSLLQVGGSFVEMTAAIGATLVAVILLQYATPWLLGVPSRTIAPNTEEDALLDAGTGIDLTGESRFTP